MGSDIYKQIYNNLNLKETDELVEIWQKNDRVEWSEDAFRAIQEILEKRLGELPSQGEPIFEHEDIESGEYEESDFEIFINDENLPEFYNPYEVLALGKWLGKAAIAAIIASIVSNLTALPQTQRFVLSYFVGDTSENVIAWLIAIVLFIFAVVLQSIIIYFPLKALASILMILMEMEFGSRGVVKTKNA